MTSDLLALAEADISWEPRDREDYFPKATHARMDALAKRIEEQIADGESALEEAPEFSLGKRIRNRPVTVQDLMENA